MFVRPEQRQKEWLLVYSQSLLLAQFPPQQVAVAPTPCPFRQPPCTPWPALLGAGILENPLQHHVCGGLLSGDSTKRHRAPPLLSAGNRPRSIYQYSSMAPRLSGQNCKFFKFLLSLNSQKRLGYKENNTKYRILTRKPRSHVRILIYRTWPIGFLPLRATSLPVVCFQTLTMVRSLSTAFSEISFLLT